MTMSGIFQGFRDDVPESPAEQEARRVESFRASRAASVAGRSPDAFTAAGVACFGGFSGGQYMAADGSWPQERLIRPNPTVVSAKWRFSAIVGLCKSNHAPRSSYL